MSFACIQRIPAVDLSMGRAGLSLFGGWSTCLVLIMALMCQPPLGVARAAQGEADIVVAHVNGESITESRLNDEIRPQLALLEGQQRRIRRTMLLRLIDNLLLEQAARNEGVTLEEYLRRNVEQVAVSDQEVEKAYQRRRNRYPGGLAPEVRYRIRREMEDTLRSDQLRRLLEKLRREAKMTNYLLEGALAELASGAAPWFGNANAPITIVEFADYRCPFCVKAQPVIRAAMAKWAPSVRLIFRQFPLLPHAENFEAAKAAVCAERQGRFWEFHEALFADGQDLSGAGLAALARAVKLKDADFAACLEDSATAERVRQDIDLGRRAGVDGTPTIFVNGRRIANVGQLDAIIQEALQQTDQPGTRAAR